MKNKKLIVLISILVFVVLVIVLGSTVFTVKKIDINWLSSTNKLSEDVNYTESVAMPYGESVFFVNKKNVIKSLEEKNPYLKVLSVETKFPNKLTVHVAERESLFALPIKNSSGEELFVVLDEEMKVLEFLDKSQYLALSKTQKPVLVDISKINLSFLESDFKLGEFFEYGGLTSTLKEIVYSFNQMGYDSFTTKGLFLNILIVENKEQVVKLETNFGINLVINDAKNLLTQKLNLAISVYNQKHNEGKTAGLINAYVFENEVYAVYKDE